MTTRFIFRCGRLALALLAGGLSAAAQNAATPSTRLSGDASLGHEVRHAVEKGRAWLEARQNTNGWWSSPDHPALTALVLTALTGPSPGKMSSPNVDKGYDYLLSCVQPDGGICKQELQSYNTSVVLSALVLRNRPSDQVVIQN